MAPPVPSLKLTVNGVDRSKYLENNTWTISQNWSRQGDTASFNLFDERASASSPLSFTIPAMCTVSLYDNTLGQTLFSGICSMPQMVYHGPTLVQWQLNCTDWTYMSDRALVVGDWQNMTSDQLAITFVNQAGAGILASTVASGGYVQSPAPYIPRLQINRQTLTQALTTLSQLASTNDTWGWYIDENRQLHRFDLDQAQNSGWVFSDASSDLGGATTGYYDTDHYRYVWDATSIRNSVTVMGSKYSQQQIDTFVGNGSQTAWPLTFTADAGNLNKATLKVNGVTRSISSQTGTSATTDWVATINSVGQWFISPNKDSTPANGAVIVLSYYYLAPVVTTVTDATSISNFSSLPNGGDFQYLINDTSIPTLFTAQQRGQREVHTYSEPQERVQFQTSENWTGHIRAGQIFTLKSSFTPDSQNGYSMGINDKFIVLQNMIYGTNGGYRTYGIVAARV